MTQDLESLKNLTFMGYVWPKYIMFEMKSTEKLFYGTEFNAKFEEKLACAFKSDIRNLANFHPTMFESLKTGTFIGSFYAK